MKSGPHRFHRYSNLLELIKVYLGMDWRISLHDILRDCNAYANFFAKFGVNSTEPLVQVHDPPPPGLSPTLLTDVLGISFIRE